MDDCFKHLDRDEVEGLLRLNLMAVEKSPSVLFRRTPAPEYRLVFVSRNISRFGIRAEDLLSGRSRFAGLYHPEDQQRVRAEIEAHAQAGDDRYLQRYRILSPDGRLFHVEDVTSTVRDPEGRVLYYQGLVTDVTERVLAEEALRASEERHRRIVETAGEGFVLMDRDLRIRDVNRAYCAMLGYEREDLLGRTTLEFASPELRDFLSANRERLLGLDYRRFEGTLVGKGGRPVPVLIHGSTLRGDAGDFLGHVAFVADLTEAKRSLVLAREVQQSLLPGAAPPLPGLDVAARSLPSEAVGGDYFDFLTDPRQPGQLTIAVGDVSGHGVDAALLMVTARAALRHVHDRSDSLAGIMARVNQSLMRDLLPTDRFMTMLLVRVRAEGSLHFAGAGQDPPLIFLPERGEFLEPVCPGAPLGVFEDSAYEICEVSDLPPGAVAVMGTDGIWEARSPGGEMYGKARFRESLRRRAGGMAGEILDGMLSDLAEFTRGARPDDDATLAVVRWGGRG